MGKKYFWLKLKEDFFMQKEIKKLRKIAGGDTYTIIYLKLQLLSLKNSGVITYDGTEKNLAEQLSLEIDEDIDNIEITLQFLKANKLIEELEENEYLLPKASECIGKEGESAERVRKHRERKALEEQQKKTIGLQGNDNALQSNDYETNSNTEKEKEKEKEIEIKKEKNKKETEFDVLINSYTSNLELKETLYEFIKMRKTIKAQMTTRALKIMLSKLSSLADNDEKKILILNNSIFNNWKGIFALKNEEVKTTNSNRKYEHRNSPIPDFDD